MSSTLTPTSPSWYARLDCSPDDVAALKRHFSGSGFSFDEMDGKFALAAPQFEACGPGNTGAVIDAATKLLNAINVALRLSDRCDGFELCGVVENRNGAIHRTMLCGSAVFRMSMGELRVNGKPGRSKQERLVSLMGRDGRVDDVAHALSALPMTWPALKKAYETVVGIMSSKSKPDDARRDFENLIAKDWLTLDESNRFYYTAAFHSHGHPRSPMRTSNPMPYEDACALIERLFWRLVEEQEG
jgi:hypothetical protein